MYLTEKIKKKVFFLIIWIHIALLSLLINPQKEKLLANDTLVVHTYYKKLPEPFEKKYLNEEVGSSSVIKSTSNPPLSFPALAPPPKAISNLNIDDLGELDTCISSYINNISLILKKKLELPELGVVKLELILNKNGTVYSSKILDTLSTTNKKYIESKIREVEFPVFTQELENYEKYTFNLIFCNEI